MNLPTQTELFEAVDATWAPRSFLKQDGWLIREGAGGGKRVSATTLLSDIDTTEINSAVTKMKSLGQTPLFMIRKTDTELDAVLNAEGYKIIDPVVILVGQTQKLARTPPEETYSIVELNAPNDNAKAIWAAGGIDQGRLNIMARVKGAKSILFADQMGVAFAAAHNDVAMIHAVEVATEYRRKGVANALMYKAFRWAKDQNCKWTAVLTVKENIPARTLYQNLGMTETAAYHYRIKNYE